MAARERIEERLQKRINVLDDTIFSLEHPDMKHVKEVYFNGKGQHFFIARECKGKLYTRLDLIQRDVTGSNPYPRPEEIAYAPEGSGRGYVMVYGAPVDPDCLIVSKMDKETAIAHFKKEYEDAMAELRAIEDRAIALAKAKNIM